MNKATKFEASASSRIPLSRQTPDLALPVAGGDATGLCPDCNTSLDARFWDDEAQLSYPCDDGESYCAGCDTIWDADSLAASSDKLMIAEELHRWAMNAGVRL